MDIDGMKIVLYVGRNRAERFYFQYRNKVKIEYCINCSEDPYEIDTFHGIPVRELDALRIKEKNELLLLEDSIWAEYLKIKKGLINLGLQEFKHFIPIGCANKKMVIIHGNCYTEPLKKYLKNVSEFTSRYYIYNTPPIYWNVEREIPDELLKRCDVFIHQNIRTRKYGEKLTDDWINLKLSKNCLRIVIPNFISINNGGVFFYPQNNLRGERRKKLIINRLCYFGADDFYIEKCINEGIAVNEIARRIQGDEVFDRETIEDNFRESMSELLDREKNWDVKISDFFLDTFRTKKFFCGAGHPTDFVIKEIVIRLLKHLGIIINDSDLCSLGKEMLDDNEIPVYQCVRDTLNLEWENDELRKDTDIKLTCGKMNVKEYVEEYIYYLEYTKQYVKEYNSSFLRKWKKEGRLIFFGAGDWFLNYMQNYGEEVSPDLIIDNNKQKWETEIHGIKIADPSILKDGDRIIICSMYSDEMEKQLLKLEVTKYAFFRPDDYIKIPV